MAIDENTFFRQATVHICGNLDIETALYECVKYLRAFVPADSAHLNIYDPGLGLIRVIAAATVSGGERLNVVIPLDEEGQAFIGQQTFPNVEIISGPEESPLSTAVSRETGMPIEQSAITMTLGVKGTDIVHFVLYAKGLNRYREQHLQLVSILNEPLSIAVSHALKYDELDRLKEAMADDIRFLEKQLRPFQEDEIVGHRTGLATVMGMVREVAPMRSPVMLLGETGVGKEIIAAAIHDRSSRRKGPFVKVNCGAIPDTLIDSELFGHERGAFTGAMSQRRGYFERADGGTIFLDEVAELPLQAQARLLRVLQDQMVLRVGGSRPVRVDTRIITATHRDLVKMVAGEAFRQDLWFRLNVFPIEIPPLRQRPEDIPAMVDHFIRTKAGEMQLAEIPKLSPGAVSPLLGYSWPGNVRELENMVERALILGKGAAISFEDALLKSVVSEERFVPGKRSFDVASLDQVVSDHVRKALAVTGGQVGGVHGAAAVLGINPSTLRNRMRKLGIPFGRQKS